jgi:hypothetical protein
MKEQKGGMRSAKMPSDHHEKSQPQAPCCGLKYATEFGNPEDLSRSTEGLASYVKKNHMKY